MEGIIAEATAPHELLALAAAHRVDEVNSIRDKAEAVRVYAKQEGGFELQNEAAEIRIRAEHRAGDLLASQSLSEVIPPIRMEKWLWRLRTTSLRPHGIPRRSSVLASLLSQ